MKFSFGRKRVEKNKMYKLKTNANVKQLLVEVFNNGINSLMKDENGDEREPVPFENNYMVTAQEENFIINSFVIPQELKDAIYASDVVEDYAPKDHDIATCLIVGRIHRGGT